MLNFYNYLYYRVYDLLSLTGNYDLEWGASHFIAANFTIFIEVIFLIFFIELEITVIGYSSVLLFLLIHLLNYFLFLKNDRYKIIITKYQKEPRFVKISGRIILCFLFIALMYSCFQV